MNTRQIVLDTETTGMNLTGIRHEGHNVIEIGALEMVNRRLTGRKFHVYLRPDRLIEAASIAVHGITDQFLLDKPKFADVADGFINFVIGAELIIHNAPFDVGFINYELSKLKTPSIKLENICGIIDTLIIARQLFPRKRNSLDALCKRFNIDNSHRTLHGALLDAKILAEVYLAMTSGQSSLQFDTKEKAVLSEQSTTKLVNTKIKQINGKTNKLRVIYANEKELQAHQERLAVVQQKSGICLWQEKSS